MKKITKESFLKWWVDGFYSLGLNSVSFNSDGEKFQKVRETIDKRIKDFDKDEDMCELSEKEKIINKYPGVFEYIGKIGGENIFKHCPDLEFEY